jgi:SSS family solute:Na+ symporter
MLGRLSFPDLAGNASDNIMPLLMTEVAGEFMGTLVLAAGLAALMSTMDSQLLTLGSIFSRDLWPLVTGKQVTTGGQSRVFVFALALSGLVVALNADTTILQLGITAFTGLAVLFPCVFFGLILKNPRPLAAGVSILVGEFFVGLYHFKLLPSFGFLPAVPIIFVSLATYLAVQLVCGGLMTQGVRKAELLFLAGFGCIFVASQDFWRWGEIGNLYFGWPGWAWYFVLLSLAQFGLTWWWVKNTLREPFFAEAAADQPLKDVASAG